MSTTAVSIPLPTLPAGWTAEKDFKAIASLTPATKRNVEPVGRHFLAFARRKRHHRTFSEDDRIQAQENVKKVEEDDSGDISEAEDLLMLQRDAKDWKGQDHYAVLGLSKYRYKATPDQIKRAHRKKVLRHHPDKKAAAGSTEDDNFFKCIQKATEVLLDPVKRRQFDSVDENADVYAPTKRETQKGNFYELWSAVFESEARFSKVQPVPALGDADSSKDDVEAFYNFWYNFDSWRSFEYDDEDVPDDNENRDQKRYIERKNNAARKKKKTEDTARLRRIVDDALSLDERIRKFRQQERAHKDRRRVEKEALTKRLAEEAAKAKEEQDRLQREKEELAKVERAEGKKVKEAAKNAAKKNKRALKSSVKDVNYFYEGEGNPSPAVIDRVLNEVELIMAKVDNEELAMLAAKLNGKKERGEIKGIYAEVVKRLVGEGKIKEEEIKHLI
ncbi:MAG: hypothetical protein M1816_002431 [Peltula sp. TS41687]|nr:MAG: hypothetical protein M1816_002431 [Peltula sp. TS41687]